MTGAFLIPGFSPNRCFDHPDFDLLRDNMQQHGVYLDGVIEAWGKYSIRDYGRLARSQMEHSEHFDVLIGHSLGAIAALAVIEELTVGHLVLCSPSALFLEDINDSNYPVIAEYIGSRRTDELSKFSVQQAVDSVNGLGLPTTITIGSCEHDTSPRLVARAQQLADDIKTAEFLEINGGDHSIRRNPYGMEVARLVGNIIMYRPNEE